MGMKTESRKMKVKPILFNTDMVRAILDGRKTATRRLVMPHCRKKAKEQNYRQGSGLWINADTDNGDRDGHIKDYSISSCWMSYSGYIKKYADYKPGDILYVRETWEFLPCIECMNEGDGCRKKPALYDDRYSVSEGCFVYRANHLCPERVCWRPSIHMPKEAARIWLRVKDVSPERLCSMELDDFLSEGVCIRPEAFNDPENAYMQARNEFIATWDSTIPKGQQNLYGWTANPWVWAIEFERCEKPEK